jgi:hypothetical protein
MVVIGRIIFSSVAPFIRDREVLVEHIICGYLNIKHTIKKTNQYKHIYTISHKIQEAVH